MWSPDVDRRTVDDHKAEVVDAIQRARVVALQQQASIAHATAVTSWQQQLQEEAGQQQQQEEAAFLAQQQPPLDFSARNHASVAAAMQRLSAGEQVMAGLAGNPASAFAPPTHTDALAAHAATALYQQQQQMIPTGAPLFRPAAALAASEAMDMNDPAAAAMGMVLSSEAPITAGTGEGAERASAPGVRQFGSRKEYNPEKKPRRVQTAFNYFTSGERRRLRTLKPGITEEEVKEQLAVLWSLMTPEKLEHYQMCQARDQARWESQTQLHEEWLALHPKPEPPPKPKPPPKLLDAVAGDAGDTGDAGDVVDDAGTTTAAAPAASGAPKKRRNPKPLVLFKLEGVTPASGEFVKVGIQRRRPPPKPLNPEATAKEDGAEAPAAEGGASSSSARKIKATGVSKLAKARSPLPDLLGRAPEGAQGAARRARGRHRRRAGGRA